MAFSVSIYRVTLLWMCISRCSSQANNLTEFPFEPSSILSNLINYAKPILQSLNILPDQNSKVHADIIEDTVNAKIKEQKSYFQDNNVILEKNTDNSLELEGNNETTIIEFIPKPQRFNKNNQKNTSHDESFRKTIRLYKKTRNNIKLALEKEKVSKKTKKMVIRDIDDMIAKLAKTHCPRNTNLNSLALGNSISIFNKTFDMTKWNCSVLNKQLSKEECDAIIRNLTATFDEVEQTVDKTLGGLTDFWSNMMNNISNLFSKTDSSILHAATNESNRYKVRCSVIDTYKVRKLRSHCEDFRLCSEEFREYLLTFYRTLNDTTVNVFRNYAAMYDKDVYSEASDNSQEQQEIISTIYNAGDIVSKHLTKIFIIEVSRIKLDKKKHSDTNIARIKKFVKKVIKDIKRHITEHMEEYLGNVRLKIIGVMKQDIKVNIGVELGNVEKAFLDKICTFFVTCNGEVLGSFRKRIEGKEKDNRVYVKVQLTLDDELKNNLVKKHSDMMKIRGKNEVRNEPEKFITASSHKINIPTTMMPVTRTTYTVESTIIAPANTTYIYDDYSTEQSEYE